MSPYHWRNETTDPQKLRIINVTTSSPYKRFRRIVRRDRQTMVKSTLQEIYQENMSQPVNLESSMAAPGQALDNKGDKGRTPLHADPMCATP